MRVPWTPNPVQSVFRCTERQNMSRRSPWTPWWCSQERRAAVVLVINRLSTAACFVHSAVYKKCPSFVLASKRLEQLSSMLWDALGVRGTVVAWAKRPVGIRFCPVSPCLAALLCIGPNRRALDLLGFSLRKMKKISNQASLIFIPISFKNNISK